MTEQLGADLMVFCCRFLETQNVLFSLAVDKDSYNKDFSSCMVAVEEDYKGIDVN